MKENEFFLVQQAGRHLVLLAIPGYFQKVTKVAGESCFVCLAPHNRLAQPIAPAASFAHAAVEACLPCVPSLIHAKSCMNSVGDLKPLIAVWRQ